MENTFDKITEFFGSNLALAPDADAARLPDDLADHVLRLRGGRVRVLLPLAADGPLGDVIRPHIRSHTGRGLAKTEKQEVRTALSEFSWEKFKSTEEGRG